jgi:hypothetical protein
MKICEITAKITDLQNIIIKNQYKLVSTKSLDFQFIISLKHCRL